MASNRKDIEAAPAPSGTSVTCEGSNAALPKKSKENALKKSEKEEKSEKSSKKKSEMEKKPPEEETPKEEKVAPVAAEKNNEEDEEQAAPVVHVDKPNPAAVVGAASFAIGTWQMQFYNIRWVTGKSHFVYVGLFLCGIIQIITGLQSYGNGDYFSYSAFTMFGCFWVIKPFLVAYPIQFLPRTLPLSINDTCDDMFPSDCDEKEFRHTEGSFVMMYALFAAVLLASALRRCLSIFVALINVTLGLTILTVGCFIEDEEMRELLDKIGGWLLVVASACAMWASFADLQILMYGENAKVGPGPSVSSLIDKYYYKKDKTK